MAEAYDYLAKAQENLAGAESELAQFVGQLIQRRKQYSAHLRRTLADLLAVRHKADYRVASVSQREARQAVQRAQEFVGAIMAQVHSEGGG